MTVLPVWGSANDNQIDNNNGQPRHVPNEEAWVGAGFNMRNPTNVADNDTPYFYVSVWQNDITSAEFNYNAGDGWKTISMIWDSDHDFKSYWRTPNPGVTDIFNKPPGTTVQYDFKLIDGTAQGWLKSDGFFGSSTSGNPYSFTIEGVSATPTDVTADSSATSTVSAWVTNNGAPVSGEVVTFSITSTMGAFSSTNNKTATATTDASGKASVQVISGYAGTVKVEASSANLETWGDTTTSVVFSSFVTDGDPADFPGDATGMASNDSRVSKGAMIWKDATSDVRDYADIDPDPADADGSSYDIDEFRVTGTSDSMRLLVTFAGFDLGIEPFVLVAIDSDVKRDTSFSVTRVGPGPASSTRDYGNWWLPANAFTGTRHLGGDTPGARGERQQIDKTGSGSDGYLPNRWTIDGSALDGGTNNTATSNNQPDVTVNRQTAAGGGPTEIKFDFSPSTYELYVGMSPWNGGQADYMIWVADDTTTATAAAPWSKAGNVMNSDDFRFIRGTPGTWLEIQNRVGSNDYTEASGGSSPQTAAGDVDDDNRDTAVFASAAGLPAEAVVDLDAILGDGGIQNGDVFIAVSSYETNNNDDGPGPRGEQWDQIPDEGASNTVGWTEWQQVFLELPSSASDDQTAEWERAIAFTNIVPGGGATATAVWEAPGGKALGAKRVEVGKSYADASKNAFEYDISWNDLLGGVDLPRTLRFTVMIGDGINGLTDQFDNYRYMRVYRSSAANPYGDTSSALDVVSDKTTDNEVADGDIDFYLDVDFNKDGQVNTTPDTPLNLGITQTGDTRVFNSGAVLNDKTPTFRWTVNDPDGSLSALDPAWQLQVDNDPLFGSPLINKQSTSSEADSTQWEATTNVPTGDTYYWRIRTRDDFGWSPWTDGSFSFRINSAPNAPTGLLVDGKTNPTDVQDNQPRFSWTFSDPDPTDGQSGFVVEVYKNSTLVYADTQWSNTNSFFDYPDTAPALEGGVKYNWRVRTKDLNDSWGAYSSVAVPTPATFQIVFGSPGARDLVIAEVGNGYGGVAGDDYVAIYNPTDSTIRLAGMSMQRWSATLATGFKKYNFTSNDTIPPYSYFLLGFGGVPNTDATWASGIVTTGDMGMALMRNTENIISGDTDKIDAVAFGAGPEGEGTQLTTLSSNGYFVVRKSTQDANTLTSLYGGNDLRWAGNYYDKGDNATDFVKRAGAGPAQNPRGRWNGTSRIKFSLTASTGTEVEENVPFTLTVEALDANDTRVSDTATSSMVGPFRLRVSAGSVSPSTSSETTGSFSIGLASDSVKLNGSLGIVTLTADTDYGVDTTGPGPIKGTLSLTVRAAEPPTVPTITAPTNGSDTNNPVAIVWSASTDSTPPVKYRVQVGTDSTFATLSADTFTYATSLLLGDLPPPDSFYVRVIALDPGDNANTSPVVQFRVVRPLDHFRLIASDPNLLVTSKTVRRGQPFNFRVTAFDPTGETVTTFSGRVTLGAVGGTFVPDSVQFIEAWGGDTTVNVTLSGDSAIGVDTITVDSSGYAGTTVVVPLFDNRLVINEVLPVDVGAGAERDEWVEIWNRSTGNVAAGGWVITDYDAGGQFTLPAVTIPSDRGLVVHYRELGTNDTDFSDTDEAAHIFPASTVSNRLST